MMKVSPQVLLVEILLATPTKLSMMTLPILTAIPGMMMEL